MKRWIHYTGIALTVASFAYFGVYVARHIDQWPAVELSATSVAVIVALVVFQIAVAVGCSLAWREIVGFSGAQVLRPRKAIAIFCKTQFAKYMPGNIAHHLGRVLLAKNEGLSAGRAALSQTVELLWNVGCAGVLGLYGLTQLVAANEQPILVNPLIVAFLAALAILGPVWGLPLGIKLVRRVLPQRVSPGLSISISLPRAIACMGAYLFSFLHFGVAMNGLATMVFGLEALNLAFVSSVCAFAWAIGFVTPGSPAGVGVRDTVLLVAFTPYYGAEAAGAVILAHRALTTVGDLAVFAFGFAIDRRAPASA